MRNELEIYTKINTDGIKEGLEEIQEEVDDEDVIVNTEETSKGVEAISKITEKIAKTLGGMTVSSAKFLGDIAGVLAKLGIIGGLLGIVAIIGLGIAKSFANAVQESEELQVKLVYLRLAMQNAMNAFASAGAFLVKVFSWVIDRVYDVLRVLGAIIKLITGINIFAISIADEFDDASASASQMKKTLAGFDEMNIVSGGGTGVGVLGDIATDFENLRNLEDEVEKTSKKIKDWFTKGLPTREELEENADTYKTAWEKVGEFLGLGTIFDDFKARFNEFKEMLKPYWQPFIDGFKDVINQIKALFQPYIDYVDEHFIKPIKEKVKNWKEDFLLKYARFINKLIYIANLFLQYFGIQLEYIDEESAVTGKDIKEKIGGAMQDVQADSDKTTNALGNLWQKLKDLTKNAWNIVTNFTANGLSKNTMNNWLQPLRDNLAKMGIKLPYLAKGGIVNMPGRGVPIGGALAGERGREAVLPLQDSQVLSEIADAIGRRITINASITNTMNGRVISKELQKINAENDFAYNR